MMFGDCSPKGFKSRLVLYVRAERIPFRYRVRKKMSYGRRSDDVGELLCYLHFLRFSVLSGFS